MEANYVHKDSTTLVQDELVKNELNQIELQYNALKQQKFNELLKENQELKLELSGYRQAILNNKEMLGLKEQNEELKKQLKPNYYVKGLEGTLKEYQQEMKKVAIQQKEFINYLEDEKNRLARECSHIYEDSLGHTSLVNEDIFDEINDILQKYKSIIGDINDKK